MTRPSRFILVAVLVLTAGFLSQTRADVSVKEDVAEKFEPSTVVPKHIEVDQSQLTIRDEIADDKLEAMSCDVTCRPALPATPGKAQLVKFDLTKIK